MHLKYLKSKLPCICWHVLTKHLLSLLPPIPCCDAFSGPDVHLPRHATLPGFGRPTADALHQWISSKTCGSCNWLAYFHLLLGILDEHPRTSSYINIVNEFDFKGIQRFWTCGKCIGVFDLLLSSQKISFLPRRVRAFPQGCCPCPAWRRDAQLLPATQRWEILALSMPSFVISC